MDDTYKGAETDSQIPEHTAHLGNTGCLAVIFPAALGKVCDGFSTVQIPTPLDEPCPLT